MARSSTSFGPGKIANPGGLTKEMSLNIRLIKHKASAASPAVMDEMIAEYRRLIALCRASGELWPKELFMLVDRILDRGVGKPAQSIEIGSQDTEAKSITDMTSEELASFNAGNLEKFLRALHQSGKLKEITASFDAEVIAGAENSGP